MQCIRSLFFTVKSLNVKEVTFVVQVCTLEKELLNIILKEICI